MLVGEHAGAAKSPLEWSRASPRPAHMLLHLARAGRTVKTQQFPAQRTAANGRNQTIRHTRKRARFQAVTKRAIEVDEKRCSGWPDIAFCFGGGCFPSKIRLVKWRGRRWGYLASQRRGQLVTSEDIDHAFQVVGHGCQADLGLCSSKSAQQESRVSEDAIFEGCEGVFYDASS